MRFTPKKTLEVIVKNQNHYVAQVKANQRKLLAHIQQTVATQPALSQFATHQQAHGRQSSWQVAVYAALPTTLTQPWLGLSHFVHVHRHRLVKGQLSQADAYFMSDLGLDAAAFAQGIRGHWGIEKASLGQGCSMWGRYEPYPPQAWCSQCSGSGYDCVEFASPGGPRLDYRGANKIWQ
ncbi:ISAs1 family transposase [Spirosoma sp. KCTC 42546]|nr:ISAs1 family transposase [Spirosoma sp. KCTC 42546]QDK81287.1 ISAs1 family transposase [Spirosoma sp. KCTC 42546]